MKILFKNQGRILVIAAIINLMFALAALISPAFFFSQFFKYAPDPRSTFPYVAMYHYLFWAVVLVMGIAFLMAAADSIKNKIVFFIGAMSKLVVAAFCVMLFVQGHGKWLMLATAITEGLLGLLMLYLYFGSHSSTKDNPAN
ncbi:MAG: hypothetical protein NT084_07655 [Bacteroidetes bacterium]|nr:hypothetical protein [Bacteroidota bacterium]